MCNINYNDLSKNYVEVIMYATKIADTFSVITNLNKPYSKIPPNCEHDKIMQDIQGFIEKQIVGLQEWPGTIRASKDPHKVMNIYRCHEQTRKFLLEKPNIFLPIQNSLPEDICFYKGQSEWLVTVSHEKIAFLSYPTQEDLVFFSSNNIKVYY